jgi:hypothetical protein
METSKILFNSTISTPGARFCSADVTNFYLNTPMEREEYVRIPFELIPHEIIDEYNLKELEHKGNVYARVDKGMYGLPQSGILANKLLKSRLEPHGYSECYHTPGLWKHKTRPIMFALVVDDFGIQYMGKDHAQHLIASLRQDYEAVTVDWTGSLFCGISLKWDYEQRTVDLSMPGYVKTALEEFKHPMPNFKEDQPFRHAAINYGVKVQLTDPVDLTEPLDKNGILKIQQVTGKFQYYCRAVDPTMNVALSALASQQSKATQRTASDCAKFLNYCATHQNAVLRYSASDMILKSNQTHRTYRNHRQGVVREDISIWVIRTQMTIQAMVQYWLLQAS